jgi:hypothetical protein
MSRFFEQLTELAGLYPISDTFIEALRQRVIRECSKVPVQVHKRGRAERRLELAACEAIVAMWQETYSDAWFPITLRPNWPRATCIIKGNTARVSFSIGPETDTDGQEIEPVEFPVVRTPPNIISKALKAFNSRDQKAERQKELAPVGTPDGRPKQPAAVSRRPAPEPPPPKPPKAKMRR